MKDGTGVADVTFFSEVQKKCGNVLFKNSCQIVEEKV
jgi:hypothetical protein